MNSKPIFGWLLACALMTGCGPGGSGDEPDEPAIPVVTPSLDRIMISGIPDDLGNFDPAPTVDAGGGFWMSYSHVSLALSGIQLVQTRVASSLDAGRSWADAGLSINPTVPFTKKKDTYAWAHEVSRLVYDPHAASIGAKPWILVWHRYLSVLDGDETVRELENGWIAMKSGNNPTTLDSERKLFTGYFYDTDNNSIIGSPEVRLDRLDPELSDCLAFTEPGLLPKSKGIYVSLHCVTGESRGKIVLLLCNHRMKKCSYLGVLIDGSEASLLKDNFETFSASELVSVKGKDYLIVTPSRNTVYRGCAIYRITNLDKALIRRENGFAKADAVFEANGKFNGACGYVEGLSGSGVMMSEAFKKSAPAFRLFTTDYNF